MRHARPYSTDGVVEQKKKKLSAALCYTYTAYYDVVWMSEKMEERVREYGNE